MSVRTRSSVSARPPPPRSRPPPPPPSFAPPPLPKTPSLNVYKRNEKTKDNPEDSVSILPPKFKIEEVNITQVVQAPNLTIEEASVPETFNFTLKPRNKTKVTRQEGEDQKIPGQQAVNGSSNEEDDLVPEIRNKCNDVNEILNRILNNDDDFDTENTEIEHETKNSSEIVENVKNSVDPFENIDNIADLTIDEVREILEKEEDTNAKLIDDLVASKEDQLAKHKHENPRRPEGSRARTDNKSKQRKSKKEQQLEKMKDFLKDPDGASDQEVELDIRLKKSDSEVEESSTELTEITETLYLASRVGAEKYQGSEFRIVELGNNLEPRLKNTKLYIQLEHEDDISSHHLQSVTNFIVENAKIGQKVVVTSNLNTGLAACCCISYLVNHKSRTRREAISLVEGLRPRVRLPSSVLLKIEDRPDNRTSYDDSLTSLSQSWLPTIFFLLLLFLLLRTFFCYLGFDRKCIYQMFLYLKQFLGESH